MVLPKIMIQTASITSIKMILENTKWPWLYSYCPRTVVYGSEIGMSGDKTKEMLTYAKISPEAG
jgi:hypothetical protein